MSMNHLIKGADMKLYLLIEIWDQDMNEPKIFTSFNKAYAAMVSAFAKETGKDFLHIDLAVRNDNGYEENKYSITRTSAWAEVSGYDYNWDILEIDIRDKNSPAARLLGDVPNDM